MEENISPVGDMHNRQLKLDAQAEGDWINEANDVLYNKFGLYCHRGRFLPLRVKCGITDIVVSFVRDQMPAYEYWFILEVSSLINVY